MNATGATPPRRAGLARIAEAAIRVGEVVSDTRSWARERRDAVAFFENDLGLEPGATIQEVLNAIAALRGREVEPVPLSSLPPDVSGIAVLGKDKDYIGLSDKLSPRHRARVLLHEVRHLSPSAKGQSSDVSVHSHFGGVTIQALKEQMSALPVHVQEEILTRPAKLRAGYPDAEERTCEVFARVVLPLLDLGATSRSTGSLNAAFSNRRII
ncbi:hypothetical protein [Streptomyces sp. NPDC058475]|uniref:hypothetical protein n=1 Tax=unclassified Streptomyces TaxID=2593676 RepID=UPI00364A583B